MNKFKYIAHRGNKFGPMPSLENSPLYIDDAIASGYDVEIDFRVSENQLWLGHDYSQYSISKEWLFYRIDKLWVHCKNLAALECMNKFSRNNRYCIHNYFWHDKDTYTLTSQNYIWAYPGSILTNNSICVMPETYTIEELKKLNIDNAYGICSDRVAYYKNTKDL